MVLLGIDPGTHRMGYGVIDYTHGQIQALDYGCFEPSLKLLGGQRLLDLHQRLMAVIDQYKPQALAIEQLYFAKNVTTGLRVAEARGVVLLAAAQAGIPVSEYQPNQIKQAVTGSGAAPKSQMQKMVQLLLKLPSLPTPDDAADGLAIAITHTSHIRFETLKRAQL